MSSHKRKTGLHVLIGTLNGNLVENAPPAWLNLPQYQYSYIYLSSIQISGPLHQVPTQRLLTLTRDRRLVAEKIGPDSTRLTDHLNDCRFYVRHPVSLMTDQFNRVSETIVRFPVSNDALAHRWTLTVTLKIHLSCFNI